MNRVDRWLGRRDDEGGNSRWSGRTGRVSWSGWRGWILRHATVGIALNRKHLLMVSVKVEWYREPTEAERSALWERIRTESPRVIP